jgi:hypothetical protein
MLLMAARRPGYKFGAKPVLDLSSVAAFALCIFPFFHPPSSPDNIPSTFCAPYLAFFLL